MKQTILSLLITSILLSCASSSKTVIAHRGASGYLPEHTLEAAAMAHSFDVDYIEPDLVLTADDRVVVLHDIHIETTTNVKDIYPNRAREDGRFYAIDFTLKELKRLRVNERINTKKNMAVFPKRFPVGKSKFEIPTFEEFIELVQGLNKVRSKEIGIYPELKSPEFHKNEGGDIAKIVFNILDKYGYNHIEAPIYVQCFYPPTLKRLKNEFQAKFPLVQLIAENSWKESSIDYDKLRTRNGLKEIASYAQGIGPYLKHLITFDDKKNMKANDFVKWAHDVGLTVHPYTHRSDALKPFFNNDKEFFKFLYDEVGADGIFSDFSDIAMKYSR